MTAVQLRNRPLLKFEILQSARDIVRQEAEAIRRLSSNMPIEFCEAVEVIRDCRGAVIVTGIGKAGWIAQKVSATLASTGTRSHFVHPSEAMHGDMGRIGPDDVVIALSNSGETQEILQILPTLKKFGVPLISLTAEANCQLAREADVVLDYGQTTEACPNNLAPSTSTTVMLAMGDALALVVSKLRDFLPTDFAKLHPGGSLGRKLSTVDEIMRPIEKCRISRDSETVRDVYVKLCSPKRRTGAILLTDDSGMLTGIFTDSDLARLLADGKDELFDTPISKVMTDQPITVATGTATPVAVETLACRNISELPVVDKRGIPLGLIDITDVVGLLPRDANVESDMDW